MYHHKSHIFFDLDHTLWDYNRNCEEALGEMYLLFDLQKLGIKSAPKLIEQFHFVNDKLWTLYDTHQITATELRQRRFREIFDEFKITDQSICDILHEKYMELSPNKPHLLPGGKEILEYLYPKYTLHIITNGIMDNQTKKMSTSGIDKYFKTITCSHTANARKPEIEIFEYALKQANTTVNEAIMIGDNYEVDIKGAQNVGMDYVYFNPSNIFCENTVKSMIKHLLELKHFL